MAEKVKIQRKIAKIMANQSKFQAEADSTQEVSIKKRCYKCIMPGCNYTAPNGFFKWPKKEYLKKKWEKICGLENVSENAKVCIPHFHPDHLIQRSQNTSNPENLVCAVAVPLGERHFLVEMLKIFQSSVK